jgi:hypothetical protein
MLNEKNSGTLFSKKTVEVIQFTCLQKKLHGRSQVGDMMHFDDVVATTAVTDKIHKNEIKNSIPLDL